MGAFVEEIEQRYGPLPPDVRAQTLDNDGKALAANRLATETFPDISERLATIEIPTLIYCGAEDDVYEPAHRASEALPNARFISLEGLNHLQAFWRSDLVLPHIRAFLRELDG
jgi:pimeloyl-ACP methyl ester carboxylesterase